MILYGANDLKERKNFSLRFKQARMKVMVMGFSSINNFYNPNGNIEKRYAEPA
ncbi:MAG: hypothetical protein IPI78_12295 [Chitinophagaceae bacterium]|nr:hypothetical protein [Chitinophagaceae bacterium]